MLVTCHNIEDFCTELRVVKEDRGALHQNAVRVSVQVEKTGEYHQDVFFYASAVVLLESSDYIVQFSKKVGQDCSEPPADYTGSETAQAWKQVIREINPEQWRILPGVLQA